MIYQKRIWLPIISLVVISLVNAAPQNAQRFTPDKMDTILYGVAYYPEYMPYERLDQDVDMMQKAAAGCWRTANASSWEWKLARRFTPVSGRKPPAPAATVRCR